MLRRFGAAAYVGFVLVATLVPASTGLAVSDPPTPWCLVCGARGVADGLLNLVFFAPLGVLLVGPLGAWRAIVGAASLSLLVEVLQLGIPGRFPTASDFVFNTAGAAVGVGLAATWRTWIRPPIALRRWFTAGWIATFPVLLLGAAWSFGPSVPDRPIYGQWTAEFGNMETYEGRILEASIGDVAAPSRRLDESERAGRALQRGDPVRVRFEAGPPPRGLAPVFSVFDDRRTRVFLLGADADDLVLTIRRRADDLRLDRPELRLRGALRGVEAGDTVDMVVERPSAATYRVTIDRPREKVRRGAPAAAASPERVDGGYTIARSWSLLLFAGGWHDWFLRSADLLWLVLLAAPLGWWAPGPRWLLFGGAVVVLALAAVPPAFGLLPTAPVHFVAVLATLPISYLAVTSLQRTGASGATLRGAPSDEGGT